MHYLSNIYTHGNLLTAQSCAWNDWVILNPPVLVRWPQMGRVFDRYGLAWLWGKVKSYQYLLELKIKTSFFVNTFFVFINTSLTDCGSTGMSGWDSTGLLMVTLSCLLESCAGVIGIALVTGAVCNLPLLSDNGRRPASVDCRLFSYKMTCWKGKP